MAAGKAIGCFGLTEPDFGSDPGGMRTRARRDGDDWVLYGTKMWITNGSVADVAVVWARTVEDGEDGPIRGIRRPDGHAGILRARDQAEDVAAGFGHQRARAGRRAAARRRDAARGASGLGGSAVLPDRGPVRHRVRRPRGGPRLPRVDDRLHPRARRSSDKPLAAYQLTQAKLADMAVELGKGMLLALHLGRLKDAGRLPARAGQHRQAEQHPRGARDRPRVPDDPRRRTGSRWSTR